MIELLIALALSVLGWLLWQLYRAKQYNQFISYINQQLKPQVLAHIEQRLIAERSELTPNNDSHIQACLAYWQHAPIRILQYALHADIVSIEQLKTLGYLRSMQHLSFVQRHLSAPKNALPSALEATHNNE